MNSFTALQAEVGAWAEANFGNADAIQDSFHSRHAEADPSANLAAIISALGVAEEAGELCHSVQKRALGIRLDSEGVGPDAERAAVGDIAIALADFCHRRGYDLGTCVEAAWNDDVSCRAWDSKTGR